MTTGAGAKAPTAVKAVEGGAPLAPEEVKDERDTAVRGPKADLSGKRVRGIPGSGGTTIILNPVDFAKGDIEHPKVEWDFRKDSFTVPVNDSGKKNTLTKEAADFITSEWPFQFEYMDSGSDEDEK